MFCRPVSRTTAWALANAPPSSSCSAPGLHESASLCGHQLQERTRRKKRKNMAVLYGRVPTAWAAQGLNDSKPVSLQVAYPRLADGRCEMGPACVLLLPASVTCCFALLCYAMLCLLACRFACLLCWEPRQTNPRPPYSPQPPPLAHTPFRPLTPLLFSSSFT